MNNFARTYRLGQQRIEVSVEPDGENIVVTVTISAAMGMSEKLLNALWGGLEAKGFIRE